MPGLLILFSVALVLISLLGSAGLLWIIHRPRRKTFAVALALGGPTQPSELGLEGDEAVFNLPGRHTSPGWIIRGHRGGGPTVVVLHGHRDSRYGALYRAKLLAPYAGRIVIFDWPAHGDCSAPWMLFGVREVADLLAVLDGLPPETPNASKEDPTHTAPKPVLFGYSLGGQIAIKAAGQHPERFAGVIAEGPYRRWDSPIRRRFALLRIPAWLFIYPIAVFYLVRGWLPGFDRAHYAGKIAAPLLVLHGTRDPICPFEEGQQLAEAAPQGELVTFEGGGHLNLTDLNPEAYHAALTRFFERLPGAQDPATA